jgi:hypothetical protein
MKINEVIDPSMDLFDILTLPTLTAIDELHSIISKISNGFSVPFGMLSHEMTTEFHKTFKELIITLDARTPKKWKDQIDEIQHWFETN